MQKAPRIAAFAAPLTVLALAAAAQEPSGAEVPPLPEVPAVQNLANARMTDREGQLLGTVAFVETPNGMLMHVRLEGVPPGVHGFHVHENGACEPPGFQSAGGHYDPVGREHGFLSPEGPHAGDLPNVIASPAGTVEADMLVHGIRLAEDPLTLFPPGGTALVLHDSPDDYKTDPSGASGERIACGVILPHTAP